jgi:hypothetical protein
LCDVICEWWYLLANQTRSEVIQKKMPPFIHDHSIRCARAPASLQVRCAVTMLFKVVSGLPSPRTQSNLYDKGLKISVLKLKSKMKRMFIRSLQGKKQIKNNNKKRVSKNPADSCEHMVKEE